MSVVGRREEHVIGSLPQMRCHQMVQEDITQELPSPTSLPSPKWNRRRNSSTFPGEPKPSGDTRCFAGAIVVLMKQLRVPQPEVPQEPGALVAAWSPHRLAPALGAGRTKSLCGGRTTRLRR